MSSRVALCILLAAVVGHAGERPWPPTADKMSIMLTVERLYWRPALPGLPAEIRFAALEGNPADAGPFTIRLALPAGQRMPWHQYPQATRMTVLSGSLAMGQEERELGAGGFSASPGEHAQLYVAREASVVQISGTGPWKIAYVHPNDDPRSPPVSKK